MIPYKCLWCNRLISHCLWSQTDHNYLTLKTCLIKTCFKYIIDFDNTYLGVNNNSQCNNCTFNQVYELYRVSRQKFHIVQLYSREKHWQIWKNWFANVLPTHYSFKVKYSPIFSPPYNCIIWYGYYWRNILVINGLIFGVDKHNILLMASLFCSYTER